MGADLVIASRTEARLLELQAEVEKYGVKVVPVVTDVTDEDSRVNLRDKTLEAFGRVDSVINNAFTIPPMDPITQIEPRKLAKVNETNVFAPLRLSALFADALSESKGSIIMLNSCVSFSSQPEYAGYKLSKGALEHLASSLATELGPRGIRVNSVAPSYIYEDVNRGYFDFLARGRGQDARAGVRREGRPDRPAAPGVVRGGRPGHAVPRLRPRLRGQRSDADRRLRRVPQLEVGPPP